MTDFVRAPIGNHHSATSPQFREKLREKTSMKPCTFLQVLAIPLALAGWLPAGDFVLVSEGRSRAEIRVAEREATGPVLFAAKELQRYVEAMSGASLPIVRGPASDSSPSIVLTADPSALAGAGAPPSPRSEDRYLLRVSERRIEIAGATPRAALFATYDLLERLGCGWCVPGDDSVPKRPTLSVPPLEVDAAPAFSYRMMLDFPLMSVAQSIAIVDWIAKNRMNWVHPCPNAVGEPKAWYERRDKLVPEINKRGLHVIFGGHTMHTWLPPEHFQAHPDWFALNDGKRNPPTLCVTSGDMTAELIGNLQRFLDRCPEVEVVDLWHPDGEAFCHCPACTQGVVPAEAGGKAPEGMPPDAMRSAYAISYIRFMNRVAGAIAGSHPRVLVSPLIYGPVDHAMPDGCPAPAENLLVGPPTSPGTAIAPWPAIRAPPSTSASWAMTSRGWAARSTITFTSITTAGCRRSSTPAPRRSCGTCRYSR